MRRIISIKLSWQIIRFNRLDEMMGKLNKVILGDFYRNLIIF